MNNKPKYPEQVRIALRDLRSMAKVFENSEKNTSMYYSLKKAVDVFTKVAVKNTVLKEQQRILVEALEHTRTCISAVDTTHQTLPIIERALKATTARIFPKPDTDRDT